MVTTPPLVVKEMRDTHSWGESGRMWGMASMRYTAYEYTPNRSRDGPKAFLKEFRGCL